MDPYIAAQIFNAKAAAKIIEENCQKAAKENNNKISKEKKRILRKIHNITARYVRDLDKLS